MLQVIYQHKRIENDSVLYYQIVIFKDFEASFLKPSATVLLQ